MANIEGMRYKFIVIKADDIHKYLPLHDIIDIRHILNQISEGRIKEGKKENNYIVINTDEPYADEVIDIMKRNGHWG